MAPEGRKALAKATGAEPVGQMRSKIARWCGMKHISKSKCEKHLRSEPLLEVEMLKKCAALWCEVHFEVKMCKTHHVRTPLLEVAMSKKGRAIVARSTFRSQNVKSTPRSDHF